MSVGRRQSTVAPEYLLALLVCGLHLGEARPVAAQEAELHSGPAITGLQGQNDSGRVVAGTVIASVLVSHWLDERRGSPAVTLFVTTGVTAGSWAILLASDSQGIVLALPALAGLTAALTEMGTRRRAPRVESGVVPPPPDPDS